MAEIKHAEIKRAVTITVFARIVASVREALKAWRDLRDRRAPRVKQVPKVRKDPVEKPAPKVRKAHKVLQVQPALRDR
jgi:hypothetical protein